MKRKFDITTAIPTIAYGSKSLFVLDKCKNLICSICTNVFSDPAQACKEGHVYCYVCLLQWLESSNTCPQCREEITQDKVTRNRYVRDLVNELKVQCMYNGCGMKGPYGEYEAHEKVCVDKPRACKYKGCKTKTPLKELSKHEKECKYRTIICEFCEKEETLINYNDHTMSFCEKSPLVMVNCAFCDESYQRIEEEKHMEAAWKKHMGTMMKKISMLESTKQTFIVSSKMGFNTSKKRSFIANNVRCWISFASSNDKISCTLYSENTCTNIVSYVKLSLYAIPSGFASSQNVNEIYCGSKGFGSNGANDNNINALIFEPDTIPRFWLTEDGFINACVKIIVEPYWE